MPQGGHAGGRIVDEPAEHLDPLAADALTAGALNIALFADGNAKRADKSVTLAAFDSKLPDKKNAILGASFVPNDSTSDADKRIVAAVTSLAPAPAKSP